MIDYLTTMSEAMTGSLKIINLRDDMSRAMPVQSKGYDTTA
jgi:hypothetical protein